MGLQQTDFVIVCPLGEERDAVLACLPGHRKLPPLDEQIWVYYYAEIPVSFPDGTHGVYSVAVLPLSKMGHTEAATATVDAIRQWQPRYVLLVGIAGGAASAAVSLGDILIADQVADYELQKLTDGQTSVRWQIHRVDQRLLLAAQNFTGRAWEKAAPRPSSGVPEVHFGAICTGNKLIADKARTDELREAWPRFVGVEMEASGVANAACQAAQTTGFFMIRCVSDLADADRESVWVRRWRSYACALAASYAVDFLKSGPIPRNWRGADVQESRADAGYLPIPATEVFVGRAAQLDELNSMWHRKLVSLVQIVADGGSGKTTLVRKWLDLLAAEGIRIPVLQWSFYDQGSHREAADSTAFLDFAGRALGIQPSALEPGDRRRIGLLVAKAFVARGGILILDGVESLQHPPSEEGGAVSDPLLHQMLLELREIVRSGSNAEPFLVVLTTRWAVPRLSGRGTAKLELPPLTPTEGADLLRQVRVPGTAKAELEFGPDPLLTRQEMEAASREFSGHPLALTLLAAYLLSAEEGDLVRRATIPDVSSFPETIAGYSHARRVMEAYDRLFLRPDAAGWNEACRQLLRVVGLFDRPVEFELIESLCHPPIAGLTTELTSSVRYNHAVTRLRELHLLSGPDAASPEFLDTHPLIREHFGRALRRDSPDNWTDANERLARTLDRSVLPAEPVTIQEMLTLYRAVAHGCRAGDYEWSWSVFLNRIQQDKQFTSTGKLGLIAAETSALSGFFRRPWSEVAEGVPAAIVGQALGRASFCLRALGRLRDASSAFEAALAHHEQQGDLKAAADDANNYSVGLMQIGDLPRAAELAMRALRYTERSGATQDLVKRHVNLAWILHYEGRASEAHEGFNEALRLLKNSKPYQPRLASTQGQRYGEFLLEANPTLETIKEAIEIGQGMIDYPAPVYQTLDPAMGYVIRGRAESLMFSLGLTQDNQAALQSLRQAEDLSRQTGHRDALVRCLIPLAAANRLAGEFQDASRYLAEAEELIEQHAMNLYQVDCALERAWLAFTQNEQAAGIEYFRRAKSFRIRYAPSYRRHDRAFGELEQRAAREE